MAVDTPAEPPKSILILGSGAFGLTTAYSLLQRPSFSSTSITLVSPEVDAIPTSSIAKTASVDTTRIIRSDYADTVYARLGKEALEKWRNSDWGAEGRYNQAGLVLTAPRDSNGAQYVRASLLNVQKENQEDGNTAYARARGKRDGPWELTIPQDFEGALRTKAARASGDFGYVNPKAGWADAEACTRWIHLKVISHPRIKTVKGSAVRLLDDPVSSRISGARLSTGEEIKADFTILATGAWTPQLIDLRGIASCRAQTLAYFDINDEEAEALQRIPIHLNLGLGCFFFPPMKKSDGSGRWEIKGARHAVGYSNPTSVTAPPGSPELSTNPEARITVSSPAFPQRGIPSSQKQLISSFVSHCLPILQKNLGRQKLRPSWSRLCHYLDTKNGDYLVCLHPTFKSLFLATGGSGHAFKFLPVLGDKIVDVLERTTGLTRRKEGCEDDETQIWVEKWSFPFERAVEDEVWCEDGSRGGEKGICLSQAMDSDEEKRVSKL